MSNASNTEEQVKDEQDEKMETTCKIYVKQPHEILKQSSLKSINDDVQRAIEGLKEIPDEELQGFLDDESFMEGLDVVDAWEGDEDKNREMERAADSTEQKTKPPSRERHQRAAREHKGPNNREKPKKEEKKRDDTQRRDPAKSTKDIERDKIRTKRDTESKLLAEKEKAIKHLLDSDNVVPPGTETEAIQSIAERQNLERAQQQRERRSRERRRSVDRYGRSSPSRRKSHDRVVRVSPHRRGAASPERRRSPFGRTSAERHRSPVGYSPGGKRRNSPRYVSDRRSPSVTSPDRRRSPRRLSWERRSSVDRRWSTERHRRRDMHERRRSRSRDRDRDRRSRSTEHSRRRTSRSPMNRRYSPRRRTRSRSPEKRARKRSPFIHELARQLRDEALIPAGSNANSNNGGAYPPSAMLNVPVYQPEAADSTRQVLATATYMHQPGPQPPLPAQPPPPPPPPPSSVMSMPSGPPGFMNFEMPVVPMTFEIPMAQQTLPPADYSSGPVMYNQPNAASMSAPPPPPGIRASMHPASVSSPQPVPAPTMDHGLLPYNPSHVPPIQQPQSILQFGMAEGDAGLAAANPSSCAMSAQSYNEHKTTSYNNAPYRQPHEERLKTPEPPVISKPKQFEKTSLSSLLEASVSAKDPSNIPVLYPGFNPEIMRHCEQALLQLPYEDPRLKMKGRFFYARDEEDVRYETEDHGSNSILLQKSKTKIYWEENMEQPAPIAKSTTQTHQKICQTDEVEMQTKGVQVHIVSMLHCETQVYPHDFQQVNREERRPIMDRLDWSVRETYDYAPKFREVDDLRLHLSNSSQRRSWNRQASPPRRLDTVDHEHHLEPADHGSRNVRRDSPFRDGYPGHRVRDHYGHARFSPEYRRSTERDEYHDRRSEHSRGESPMELEDSDENGNDDNGVMTGHTYQRESEWHGRGRGIRGKGHTFKGKHPGGRPYRSRGGHRGKF